MTRLNIVSIYLVDDSLTEVLVRVLRMCKSLDNYNVL
ncbi:hypothetical protein SALIVB_0620 [Streptococcus salivarius CCHSS3]|nr:hypothetical protein SALIVB_0620 [Streptococcus salivarius CCHSS3]